jgi:hypothetical protein
MASRPKFDIDKFLARFDAMDRALVAAGWHATSPWWRAELERFLRSGGRRWVIRAGRRAGKSTFLCRLSVCWAKWGSWSIPKGDIGVIPFVSVDRSEAASRLRTISQILKELGIPFEERAEDLELPGRVLFKVVSATVKGTVGFTSVAIFADEMSRWESRDSAANPAQEVMSGLRPTAASQRNAFEVCSSSPFSVDDYHAVLFDQGNTEHQYTSFGETWTCNPTITEEQTHELEPDARIWSREYGAVPGVAISSAFDPEDLAAAYERKPVGAAVRGLVGIDASSLRGDGFGWVAGYETSAGELIIKEAGEWTGNDLRHMTMQDCVNGITARAQRWNTQYVYGDQCEGTSLQSMFAAKGITFRPLPWSAESKEEAFQLLRRLARDGKLSLCDNAGLKSELGKIKARLSTSGLTTYITKGLDTASALLALAHAAVERRILAGTRASPLAQFYRDNSFPLNRSRRYGS